MNSIEERENVLMPSRQQETILNAVEQGTANIIIQACAGAGKTTMLKMICNILTMDLRVLAVCFNKSTALEFGQKLPPNVESRTLHYL